MQAFTTLIPLARNDGSPVTLGELDEILLEVWESLGGLSVEGTVEGYWLDQKDERLYRDVCLKLTAVCPKGQLGEAEALIRRIGRRLGQKAMYFEVRSFDRDPILPIEGSAAP